MAKLDDIYNLTTALWKMAFNVVGLPGLGLRVHRLDVLDKGRKGRVEDGWGVGRRGGGGTRGG